MSSVPKLIVTCRSSSVELCEHEIGNVIFPRDPLVRIEKSRYSGVLFVYTTLDPEKAYTIVSHREYGFVENIVPVYCVLEYQLEDAKIRECIKEVVKSNVVKLKVKSRGARGISRGVFKLMIKLLNSIGVSHNPNSKTCLYVEIFENRVYVGVGDCYPVFKANIKIR